MVIRQEKGSNHCKINVNHYLAMNCSRELIGAYYYIMPKTAFLDVFTIAKFRLNKGIIGKPLC